MFSINTDRRKPCELGHFDCLGANSKDPRCSRDPSRCERTASGKRGRHEYDYNPDEQRTTCIRCGKAIR